MQSFIYIEASAEGIDSSTKQIAGGIRRIGSEVRGPLKGISIGSQLEGREDLARGIVDELIRIEVPAGMESNTEVIAKILTSVVRENGPAILLMGYTHQGMELGPAVGWRLQIPVLTNCIGIDWTGGKTARIRRPIQGGKLIVSIDAELSGGAVISVQKGAWKEDGQGSGSEGSYSVSTVSWREAWGPEKTEVLGIIEEGLGGEEDITKAEILVSVGRGLGDPDNLPIMRDLAEKLGGMLSCSRPVVDLGWLPALRQVGISGRTVAPVVYLALGISGQANHLAGMDGARITIAVNKDSAAPIFGVAKYGVVDDILDFVPELLAQIALKQSA